METVIKEKGQIYLTDKIYTAEQYLLLEDQSVEKHEFFNGEVIKMPGATPTNNLIASNIITQLNISLANAPKEYFVLNSDSKIHIPRFRHFVYPDAVVVCEHIELFPGSTTVITNPLLIVEVLSPSTEQYDRQSKFNDYKQIPSFKEYLLISQKLPYALASFKSAERTWEDLEAEGLDSTIHLRSVECTLDLKKIYRGVRFEEA